jgi:uncharacterized membrane protein YidH (DUF202 family)
VTTPGPGRREPLPDAEERDPGLARERTDLAWTRTALSFAALGAALLHTNVAAALLVLAIAVGVWLLGQLSARDLQPAAQPRRLTHRHVVQLVTVTTVATSMLALVIALTSHVP